MSGLMNTVDNKDDDAKKPAAASNVRSTDVNLKVKSQKFRTMHFRMKRHTPLQELVNVFTRRHDVYQFQFLHYGKRINPHLTALQSGMKDGDAIEAMLQVDGGGRRRIVDSQEISEARTHLTFIN